MRASSRKRATSPARSPSRHAAEVRYRITQVGRKALLRYLEHIEAVIKATGATDARCNHHGWKRALGHAARSAACRRSRRGAKSVRAVVETAAREGIDTLTLYAFSAPIGASAGGNCALMKLFGQ